LDGTTEIKNYYVGYIYKLEDLDKITISTPTINSIIPEGDDVTISWEVNNLDFSQINFYINDTTDNNSQYISANLDNTHNEYILPSSYFISGHKYEINLDFQNNNGSRIIKHVTIWYGTNQ
jgi:hypothetical protein